MRPACLYLIVAILPATLAAQSTPTLRIDTAGQEITITVDRVVIPAARAYAHHAEEKYHVIAWPVTGWMTGYQVDLLDSAGTVLPRALLHHAGMANLDRRQLAYPIAERVLAAAHETGPVMLPRRMGVQLSKGQRLVFYYALVNPADQPLVASVRVRMGWAPQGTAKMKSVVPFYANAVSDSASTISFDVPPGRSEQSAVVMLAEGGWLRAVGGHLHDQGVELRLEDVTTGKTLARVRSTRDSAGKLQRLGLAKFMLRRRGLPLEAGRPYRVVAVYDNPTADTLKGGAMGFLAGIFVPRGQAQLAADTTHARYARDARALLGEKAVVSAHAHH
jgi:hypothetical protein